MLDANDLMLVAAISRGRSVRRAAELLGVHLSTVFRRLDALEQSLGTRLFERLREGYALTSAGERAMVLAEQVEQQITDLERELRGQDMRPSGSVRVTTTDTLVTTVLTPVFASFAEAYPEIKLEVIVSNQRLELSKRDADVAIRPAPEAPDSLVGKRLCAVAMAIYGAPTHVKGKRTVKDYGNSRWIAPDDSLAHTRAARWIEENCLEHTISYRTNTLVGMFHGAKAGLGLAILPCYLADREPGLTRVPLSLPDFAASLWLLTHPDLRNVARIRVFLDWVARELEAYKPLIEGRLGKSTHRIGATGQ